MLNTITPMWSGLCCWKERGKQQSWDRTEGDLGQLLPPLPHQWMLLHGVYSHHSSIFHHVPPSLFLSQSLLPMATACQGRHPSPYFVLESCLPTLCSEELCPGVMQLSSFVVSVSSSRGKCAFIASPTAKHFGHEKYINVTTSFITAFILHLMLSYVTYTQNTFLKESAYFFI